MCTLLKKKKKKKKDGATWVDEQTHDPCEGQTVYYIYFFFNNTYMSATSTIVVAKERDVAPWQEHSLMV